MQKEALIKAREALQVEREQLNEDERDRRREFAQIESKLNKREDLLEDKLQEITDKEQEQVGILANLDRKRAEITSDIANVLNKKAETLKLRDLIAMLSARPAEQKALAAAHDRLGAVVYELKRVNEQNKELLDNALEMISFEMNLVQSTQSAPETANYNKGAYNTGNTMGVSTGRFDAKQ